MSDDDPFLRLELEAVSELLHRGNGDTCSFLQDQLTDQHAYLRSQVKPKRGARAPLSPPLTFHEMKATQPCGFSKSSSLPSQRDRPLAQSLTKQHERSLPTQKGSTRSKTLPQKYNRPIDSPIVVSVVPAVSPTRLRQNEKPPPVRAFSPTRLRQKEKSHPDRAVSPTRLRQKQKPPPVRAVSPIRLRQNQNAQPTWRHPGPTGGTSSSSSPSALPTIDTNSTNKKADHSGEVRPATGVRTVDRGVSNAETLPSRPKSAPENRSQRCCTMQEKSDRRGRMIRTQEVSAQPALKHRPGRPISAPVKKGLSSLKVAQISETVGLAEHSRQAASATVTSKDDTATSLVDTFQQVGSCHAANDGDTQGAVVGEQSLGDIITPPCHSTAALPALETRRQSKILSTVKNVQVADLSQLVETSTVVTLKEETPTNVCQRQAQSLPRVTRSMQVQQKPADFQQPQHSAQGKKFPTRCRTISPSNTRTANRKPSFRFGVSTERQSLDNARASLSSVAKEETTSSAYQALRSGTKGAGGANTGAQAGLSHDGLLPKHCAATPVQTCASNISTATISSTPVSSPKRSKSPMLGGRSTSTEPMIRNAETSTTAIKCEPLDLSQPTIGHKSDDHSIVMKRSATHLAETVRSETVPTRDCVVGKRELNAMKTAGNPQIVSNAAHREQKTRSEKSRSCSEPKTFSSRVVRHIGGKKSSIKEGNDMKRSMASTSGYSPMIRPKRTTSGATLPAAETTSGGSNVMPITNVVSAKLVTHRARSRLDAPNKADAIQKLEETLLRHPFADVFGRDLAEEVTLSIPKEDSTNDDVEFLSFRVWAGISSAGDDELRTDEVADAVSIDENEVNKHDRDDQTLRDLRALHKAAVRLYTSDQKKYGHVLAKKLVISHKEALDFIQAKNALRFLSQGGILGNTEGCEKDMPGTLCESDCKELLSVTAGNFVTSWSRKIITTPLHSLVGSYLTTREAFRRPATALFEVTAFAGVALPSVVVVRRLDGADAVLADPDFRGLAKSDISVPGGLTVASPAAMERGLGLILPRALEALAQKHVATLSERLAEASSRRKAVESMPLGEDVVGVVLSSPTLPVVDILEQQRANLARPLWEAIWHGDFSGVSVCLRNLDAAGLPRDTPLFHLETVELGSDNDGDSMRCLVRLEPAGRSSGSHSWSLYSSERMVSVRHTRAHGCLNALEAYEHMRSVMAEELECDNQFSSSPLDNEEVLELLLETCADDKDVDVDSGHIREEGILLHADNVTEQTQQPHRPIAMLKSRRRKVKPLTARAPRIEPTCHDSQSRNFSISEEYYAKKEKKKAEEEKQSGMWWKVRASTKKTEASDDIGPAKLMALALKLNGFKRPEHPYPRELL